MWDLIIKKLKNRIATAYISTAQMPAYNMFRGHLRSISVDIEDAIAIFISDILPTKNYKLFLDPSIHINGNNNKLDLIRPDLLVVSTDNNSNKIVAMIEIKANMGWCRDAKGVIDDIATNNNRFLNNKTLTCEFSKYNSETVQYGNDVKLYLLSLTDNNCPSRRHNQNKDAASNKGIRYFNLFTGDYDSLVPKEVQDFINDLLGP